MASLYQNPGPPGTYRQNQGPPPPPPPSQYPTSNAYNYGSVQPASYGANMGTHSQMAYNPSYAYGVSGATYGPPGIASQNQYPPLPPYSVPSQPPPPPPPALSAASAPPPPPPLPPMSSGSLPPPPPPPLQPTSHHGMSYALPSTNSTNLSYQEGLHSAYYPSSHSTQLPPPPPPLSSYLSSSQALNSLGAGPSSQIGSAPAASSRQNPPQASAASPWLTGLEANKASLKPNSALKPGLASALDKIAGASKVPGSSKPPQVKADNRTESERGHQERKRSEYERRKLEEKKESKIHLGQASHKLPASGTQLVKHGSAAIGKNDRKEKFDNRLKRPSTFVCKIKFRNELPDPVSQPKLLQVNNDRDRYCKYSITSLEKTQKHRLLVDSDLGIPLDLLDISIYNAPKVRPPMDPEDEELLRDDEKMPMAKTETIRRKDRPTDKGVAWLVKTQYISPINLDPAKQALTEKQAKKLKEIREGKGDLLDSLNDREHQIQSIQESFRVTQQIPVHQTKPHLQPIEILPLLPDFKRQISRLTHVTFDGEPTADSELHNKLDRIARDELEALAILKMYTSSDAETGKQERFLAYMVPKVEELNSDYTNEMSYTWMREYHMEARPEETQNVSSYVFTFGDESVKYLPLQQKVSLQKKKAKERIKEEFENAFAVPSSVTVRRGEDHARDEEEGRTAHHKLSQPEGTSHVEGRNGLKRRQSDDGEFARMPKRREVSRDVSDDEEDGYT